MPGLLRGRSPRLIPVMLLLLTIAGCRTSPTDVLSIPSAPERTVSMGTEFSLAIGESVVINGGEAKVTLAKLLGDSRCPTHATISCVWAGSVQFALAITDGGEPRSAEIESVPTRDVVKLNRFQLQLVGVTPERLLLDSIPVAEYRARMIVTRK